MNTPTQPPGDAASTFDIVRAAWAEDIAASEAVRLSTIQILGFMSLLGGLLIALTAPINITTYVNFDNFPGWPLAVGITLAVCGAVQLVGVFSDKPKLCVIGCLLAALWYAAFASAFVASWISWLAVNPHIGDMPVIYPAVPYFGAAAIHAVQALTTHKKIRDKLERDRLLGGLHG